MNTEEDGGILSGFSCRLRLVKLLVSYTRSAASRETDFQNSVSVVALVMLARDD